MHQKKWVEADALACHYAKDHASPSTLHLNKTTYQNMGAELDKTEILSAIMTASDLALEMDFCDAPKAALLRLLQVLRDEHSLNESNSLLSDRTFLVKAVQMMKTHAVIAGRSRCIPEDLRVRHFNDWRGEIELLNHFVSFRFSLFAICYCLGAAFFDHIPCAPSRAPETRSHHL